MTRPGVRNDCGPFGRIPNDIPLEIAQAIPPFGQNTRSIQHLFAAASYETMAGTRPGIEAVPHVFFCARGGWASATSV